MQTWAPQTVESGSGNAGNGWSGHATGGMTTGTWTYLVQAVEQVSSALSISSGSSSGLDIGGGLLVVGGGNAG